MVPLPLRSTELEELGSLLMKIAATLDEQGVARADAWNGLQGFTNADSLLAGIGQLHRHNSSLLHTAQRMGSAAQVLLSTAGAVRVLESSLHIVERLTDYSPATTAFLTHIARMGELLDLVCAAQINAICTPEAPTPLQRLGDFDDLPATSIHEFNLMNAPPDIQKFAADNPDVMLLEVGEGSGGDGRAFVAAIGDVDKADALVTMVAGVSSSDPAHWQGNIDRARTLGRSSGAATVMWLGYTAPHNIPLAVSTRAAEKGGRELQQFQESLAVRNPQQRKVVVGYSYGSVVVGKGAQKSAENAAEGFDAVVLVGSPGAGVTHARELNTEVYAVTGTEDPIGLAATRFGGIHGTDPTSPWFGSTVWDSAANHSGYWEDPDFLRQLTTVITKD